MEYLKVGIFLKYLNTHISGTAEQPIAFIWLWVKIPKEVIAV